MRWSCLALLAACSSDIIDHTQFLGDQDMGTNMTGETDAGGGCASDQDCPNGSSCWWLNTGCGPDQQLGVCYAGLGIDACLNCNWYCDCNGVTHDGKADGPFAHHGVCEDD